MRHKICAGIADDGFGKSSVQLGFPADRKRELHNPVVQKRHADLNAGRHTVSVVIAQKRRKNRLMCGDKQYLIQIVQLLPVRMIRVSARYIRSSQKLLRIILRHIVTVQLIPLPLKFCGRRVISHLTPLI